mgnify:FL=1
MIKVRNNGNVPLLVDIRNIKTQKITQVHIMPKGGVTLPKDYIVDPNYAVRNKLVLRIIEKD